MKRRKIWRDIVFYLVLAIILIILLFPVVIMLNTAADAVALIEAGGYSHVRLTFDFYHMRPQRASGLPRAGRSVAVRL